MPNLYHLPVLMIFAATLFGMTAPVKKPISTVSAAPVASPVHSKEETAEHIPWQEERLLSWDDFKGPIKHNTDAVASTSTSLGIAYQILDGNLVYQITCNFSKHSSWGSLKTDYILAHEQAHFDITEIYARKLHQALSNYKLDRMNYQRDIGKIYNEIVEGKEAMQKAYDGESDHSRKRKTQMEWLEKIDQQLQETAPYEAYP
jgi:hypothetical protein